MSAPRVETKVALDSDEFRARAAHNKALAEKLRADAAKADLEDLDLRFVVTANAWMQTPVGFREAGGWVIEVDPWAVVVRHGRWGRYRSRRHGGARVSGSYRNTEGS